MKTYVLFVLFLSCYFPNLTNGLSTAGRIVKTGYYEIPGTNGLYKYHDTQRVWDDAAATCAAEGATLYYAENDKEFYIVIKYWQTKINNFPKKFFVGIKKSGGVFKTVNGIPMVNVYNGWMHNEPNNQGGNENCVEVWNYPEVWGLNDKACYVSTPFLCKVPNIDGQCNDSSCIDEAEGNIGTSPGYYNIPGTNGLYKYYSTLSVWHDAAATCAAEGATLYYAENDNEFYIVIKYWQTKINDFPKEFFVGIKKSGDVFKTINGIPIYNVYNGWMPGEPNNQGNENCVEVWNYPEVWGLNDKACDVRKPFLCKLPNIDGQCNDSPCIDEATEGNIGTSGDYYNIPGINGLYKYHDTLRVWHDAAATCAVEGARLYYAENENQLHTVVSFWQTMRNDFPKEFFVGIKKSGDVFKTINGIPIYNVYNKWMYGEPNNSNGKENCVEVWNYPNVSGLNDKACDVPKPFICKK